jgi:hypothetical protein
MEGALPQQQNVFMRYQGKDQFVSNVDKNGTPQTKTFNVSDQLALNLISKDFGVDTKKGLEEQNITLKNITSRFFMGNGQYMNKEIFGNSDDLSKIKLVGIDNDAYILEKFYAPTDGMISTEIWRKSNGQHVMTPYIKTNWFTDDGSLKLQVFENGKPVMKKISELVRKSGAKNSGYNVKEVKGGYEFSLLKEVDPYENTKQQNIARQLSNQNTLFDAGMMRGQNAQKERIMMDERINKINTTSSVKIGGFYYGKNIPRDAKSAIEKLKSSLGNNVSELQMMQAIGEVVSTAPENEQREYQKELIREWNSTKSVWTNANALY